MPEPVSPADREAAWERFYWPRIAQQDENFRLNQQVIHDAFDAGWDARGPAGGEAPTAAMVEAAIKALQGYRREAGEAGWPESALIIESFPLAVHRALEAALAVRGPAGNDEARQAP